MDGIQGWHLVILANVVVLAAVIVLIYSYFRVVSKRREKRGARAERSRPAGQWDRDKP